MAIGGTWKQVGKATLKCKDYAVFGLRLYDEHWYGPDGMWDRAESLPLDKFKIDVYSWYDAHGHKMAGWASPIRLTIEFNNRDDANEMWLFLKKHSPSLEELEKIHGFKSWR